MFSLRVAPTHQNADEILASSVRKFSRRVWGQSVLPDEKHHKLIEAFANQVLIFSRRLWHEHDSVLHDEWQPPNLNKPLQTESVYFLDVLDSFESI